MTITRRWQTGFESGNINEFPNGLRGSPGVGTTRKTGSYGLTVYNMTQPQAGLVVISATKQIRTAWWGYLRTRDTDAFRSLWGVESSGGTVLASVDIEGTNYGGKMRVDAGGNIGNSSANVFTPLGWHHWAVDLKINSTTGWMNLYKNGALVASVSGNTGNTDLVTVYYGSKESRIEIEWYLDDIYLDDTTGEASAVAPPMKRFYWLSPNGNGNYAQWDGSDGNSTDNYLLVDERPPSDSDYVETAVTDEYDSYAMGTITLGANQTPIALIPISRADREGSTEQIALGTRLSSTDLVGSDQTPTSTLAYYWERQTTKPGGGSWGQSDIDSVEMINKSRGTY